jgi:predicted PurR-regulated permease PerM
LKKYNINLQEVFFFILLIAITIGFYSVIKPFIIDIFLTIILAILFKKPYRFLSNKFKKHQKKASFLTILLVFFTIVIPLIFIGVMISKEVGDTYSSIENNWPEIRNYIEKLPERAAKMPVIKDHINHVDWKKVADSTESFLSGIAQFLIKIIQETFINVGFMIVHFFIILFLLYFVLLDGKKLVERIQYLVPLKDSEENELIGKLEKVTDAIVFNSFMIGFLEGAYGGILFTILGIPSPFFWGMMMTFLSIIPIVGANSVLVPMGLYQIFIGNVVTGIIVLVVGAGAIVINQNIIRPRLDGSKSDMHPAIIFLASMGGLFSMGIVGFIAGPMITGLFIVMWDFFGKRYRKSLERFNKGQ